MPRKTTPPVAKEGAVDAAKSGTARKRKSAAPSARKPAKAKSPPRPRKKPEGPLPAGLVELPTAEPPKGSTEVSPPSAADIPPPPPGLIALPDGIVLPPVVTAPRKFAGLSTENILEATKCKGDGTPEGRARACVYFIRTYCVIDDKQEGTKFRFDLWKPMQEMAVEQMVLNRYLIALKARQVGFTWMALCKALWTGLFDKPSSTVLLFSLTDTEAKELLSRVKRVYHRLPGWMKCKNVVKTNDHEFSLSNGTEYKAFPTGRGDSYTASMAILDEFDLVEPETQKKMMQAIGPTIAVGGQIYLISKVNKQAKWSESFFKTAYNKAKEGKNEYTPLFIPWYGRPDYTQAFYDAKRRAALENPGGMDDLYSNYPETDLQALSPSTGDKRFLQEWLEAISRIREPMTPDELRNEVPMLTHLYGLKCYKGPSFGAKYVGGCDPAQGTPASNPSGICLTDAKTGEEVCSLNEKLTPAMTASAINDLTRVYMGASWLIERNNHGIAVLQSLHDHFPGVRVLPGHDGKPGWLATGGGTTGASGYSKTKVMLYDRAADLIREGHGIIHSHVLWSQMAQVELSTLESPITPGNYHGDLAAAFVLALYGGTIDKSGEMNPRDYMWQSAPPEFRAFGVQDPGNGRQSLFGQNFGQAPGTVIRQRQHNPFGRS